MTTHHDRKGAGRVRGARAAMLAAALVCAAAVGACDVVNPGPVEDQFLGEPGSQEGLVNGSTRRLAEAVSWEAYTTGLLSREIFPGGQTGAHGHDVLTQGGYVQPGSYAGYFDDAQQARFIAETAIDRLTAAGAPDALLFKAQNMAGYAYRNLGENWCQAVLDGGALQPGTIYFQRAVEHFTEALGLAATDDERYAALAGRAAAEVWLGDWSAAVADAHQVPDDFVFWLNLDQQDQETENHIYFANANSPYRAYTIWKTFYEGYYADTGDPRTPWVKDPALPFANAALSGYGQVPWINQRKYTSRNDDMRLASGWEMRLIEAEAALVDGDVPAAVALINHVRTRNVSDVTGDPLEPWQATTLEEAWTALKRERGIELWLEGRRLGDQRRWQEQSAPGDLGLPNFESVSKIFSQHPRSLCFDIPDSERDANPNVPASTGG